MRNKIKPNVWMIIPSFYPAMAGAETQLKRISSNLIKQGWSVIVLTRRHDKILPQNLPKYEILDNIPIVRVNSRGNGKWGALAFSLNAIWFLINNGRKSIYHAHDLGSASWIAIIAKFLLNGWSVIKLRGDEHHHKKMMKGKLSFIKYKLTLYMTDIILTVCQSVNLLMKNELKNSSKKVRTVLNGVDINDFSPVDIKTKIDLRHEFNLPLKKIIILYVGRLESIKGLDLLIMAMKKTIKDGVDPIVLIVGDGTQKEELIKSINYKKMQNYFIFSGEKEDVSKYYNVSDIFVLPSRTEGFSNSLVEAMASGLAVIASNVGGNKEIIQNNVNGFLFKTEDYISLYDKLYYLISRERKRFEFSKRARKTIVNNASLNHTINKLSNIYNSLIINHYK